MARYIPPHPKKGSPEAYAWAARMRAARGKRGSRRTRKTNPGALWHAKKRRETTRQERAATPKWQKDFFHGKSTAHLESALAAKAMGMNPKDYWVYAKGGTWHIVKRLPPGVRGRGPFTSAKEARQWIQRLYEQVGGIVPGKSNPCGKRAKRNPLVVYGLGNPGGVKVAGVIYNRVREIRAEKTGSFQPGAYKHPFSRSANVCALALDNGDILIHSKANKPLWRRA